MKVLFLVHGTFFRFVGQCYAYRDISAGEQLTYDYYTDFAEEPLWFEEFKSESGVRRYPYTICSCFTLTQNNYVLSGTGR